LPAVAELLGFSTQSALARWFREEFGRSITQWPFGILARLPSRGCRRF
jgi:AraC-like DNA-binding protein